MSKILVFGDTETSGLDEKDRICQLAFSYKKEARGRCIYQTLCNPGIDIVPEAAMVTGIYNKDVSEEEALIETFDFKKLKAVMKEDNAYFVAYNAGFDVDMLAKEGLIIPEDRVIDLYKIVRVLFKDTCITNRDGENVPLSNLKMQYLRVILNIDENESFQNLVKEYGLDTLVAHTALSDIVVLEYLFYWVMDKFNLSLDDMIEINKTQILEDFITFGNIFEKGTPYRTILRSLYSQNGIVKFGYDYLDWCVENMEMREDTLYSIKTHFYRSLIMGEIEYKEEFRKYIEFGLETEESTNKIRKAKKLLEETDE